MTPIEAAKVIGCHPMYCRRLIRDGKIKAKVTVIGGHHYYDVTQREAERFRDAPVSKQGYPRGQKRTPVKKTRKRNVRTKPE